MESIYKLAGRAEEYNAQAEALQAEIDELEYELADLYEENGGEVTEDTEKVEAKKADLAKKRDALTAIGDLIVHDIAENSDAYAEWALNKEAARKQAEAELKALKEQCAAAIKRAEARVRRFAGREEWAKQQFADALNLAQVDRFGGSKTDKQHSIYFKTTDSIDADLDTLTAPYQDTITEIEGALPGYLKVKIDVAKTTFKGVSDADLPKGAERVYKQTIIVK